MRRPRKKRTNVKSCYFITTRVAGGQFLFDSETLDFFWDLLLKVAYFSGAKLISYSFMTNHIHLLVMIRPVDTIVSDKKVIKRVRRLYGNKTADRLQAQVNAALEQGDEEMVKALLAPYRKRMNELSEFLKTLKQRMTIYVNDKLKREGTLWQGRFHSVLVENHEHLLRIIAAYIDLNPVRVGMSPAPGDYRWSSIGDACSQGRRQEIGLAMLASLYPSLPKEVACKTYLALLASKLAKDPDTAGGLDVCTKNPYLVKSSVLGRPSFIRAVAGPKPIGGTTFLTDRDRTYMSVGRVAKKS